MKRKSFLIGMLAVIILIVAGISFFLSTNAEKKEFRLVPKERKAVEETPDVTGTEVGTGWSISEQPEKAAEEAISMALKGKKEKSPDFAILFATSGSDMSAILAKARALFGEKTKIYGGTSDSRAVITNRGFVAVTKKGYEIMRGEKAIAVMTITSQDIAFGVGSADFSAFSSVQEASKSAMLMAIKSSGKSESERPQAILITPTQGWEEEVIEGIEQVVGKNTLLLGGTAGGPDQAVLGEGGVYQRGVSMAVLYTDLPVGWTFEGGFDVRGKHSGIVTKVVGQAIVEIDHRPALDVYNEWLGGKIKQLVDNGVDSGVIRDLLILHPIYRKYTSSSGEDYFLFSHPWPRDDTFKDRSVSTSTKIKVGERIYLSHGTWDTLINRIGNLPKKAKTKGGLSVNEKPILGIGHICAGVMGTIPEEERKKMSFLINYGNAEAPFIANFTWGEQGHFPGISNKHGNLLCSFLVIGKRGYK